ncbi:TPA: CDP-glycerol glycerophosphotransferase family protein [Citrobacter pasteurii]
MKSNCKEAIITVIIPVYRVEKYIKECLDSVLAQRLDKWSKKYFIEIICIDDGSPDRSEAIIMDYIKGNDNIILLKQLNQGQSVARNNALQISHGKYIVFLDSDDLLPPDSFISLLATAERTGSEVIVSHAKAFNSRRSWYIEPHAEVACSSFQKVKFTHRAILINSSPPWGKMYSRELLVSNNIIFPEGIKLAEDWIFVIHAMYRANHISSTTEITYLYRGRDDEDNPSCTQLVNKKVFTDLLKVHELSKTFTLPPQQVAHANMFILRSILYRLSKFSIDNSLSECKPIYKMVREFLLNVIGIDKINLFTPVRRLPLLLLYYGFYSETHRIMNSIYTKTCIKKGISVSCENIISDYKVLVNKRNELKSFKRKIKEKKSKAIYLYWRAKYNLARLCSKVVFKDKRIALIGERLGNTANDSSYFLFDYIKKDGVSLKENYYYVIKKNAKTATNLSGFSNVIWYGSFKHFMVFNAAHKYIFSDSMRDVFFRWKDVAEQHNYKKKYFLQHGVFATSRAAGYYDRNSMFRRNELPDKFIVSSDFEKSLVCKNFDFEPERVVVTGLSRFDKLPKNNKVKNKKILVLLTWRDELSSVKPDKFVKSTYYKKLMELLNDNCLKSTLSKYGYTIEACLHHKMSLFLNETINEAPFKVHDMNKVNVQELLINSDIMITDFSSAVFDMVYQNKPVIFYWFDEISFFAKRGGPLISPLTGMPGPICRNVNDIENVLISLLKSNVAVQKQYASQYKRFFKYRDNRNCKRIINVIEE